MKKRILKSSFAVLAVTALVFIAGCEESVKNSSPSDAQLVRQLKLEKAQIMQEFSGKETYYIKTIEQKQTQIDNLESQMSLLKEADKGGNAIIAELIQEISKLEEKNATLEMDLLECQATLKGNTEKTDSVQQIETEATKEKEPKGVDNSALDKIRALQRKAAEKQ